MSYYFATNLNPLDVSSSSSLSSKSSDKETKTKETLGPEKNANKQFVSDTTTKPKHFSLRLFNNNSNKVADDEAKSANDLEDLFPNKPNSSQTLLSNLSLRLSTTIKHKSHRFDKKSNPSLSFQRVKLLFKSTASRNVKSSQNSNVLDQTRKTFDTAQAPTSKCKTMFENFWHKSKKNNSEINKIDPDESKVNSEKRVENNEISKLEVNREPFRLVVNETKPVYFESHTSTPAPVATTTECQNKTLPTQFTINARANVPSKKRGFDAIELIESAHNVFKNEDENNIPFIDD
jgi:hypothetical protein